MGKVIKFIWFIIFILAGIMNLYIGTWWGATIAFIAAFITILMDD